MERRWPFTVRLVQSAPDLSGVFALWEDRELIFIGRAQRVRAALLDHLEGANPCTRRATHYDWQLSFDAAAKERELLEAYRERHRALPRCNRSAQ